MHFLFEMVRWVGIFLNALSGLIFIYTIMTWIVKPTAPIYRFVYQLVDPFLSLIRPLAHRISKNSLVDFTPFLAIIAIQVLQWALNMLVFVLL